MPIQQFNPQKNVNTPEIWSREFREKPNSTIQPLKSPILNSRKCASLKNMAIQQFNPCKNVDTPEIWACESHENLIQLFNH